MAGDLDLSERELEILKLLSTGASNKEIAQQLVISPNTVKVHLRNIFSKIGVVSRTEATLYALKIGLIHPEGAGAAVLPEPLPEPPPQPVPWYAKISTRNGLFLVGLLLLIGIIYTLVRTNTPSPNTNPTASNLNRWSSLAALPDGRSDVAVEHYDNYIFLFSGKDSQGLTASVLAYDSLLDSWSTRAPKPTPVTGARAALIGERIYIPGGTQADGSISRHLEIYDPRSDTWSGGAELPVPVSQYGLAPFEGRLYLFGGWNGQRYLANVWVYNPGSDDWTQLKDMPSALGKAAAATSGSKIYLVGGTDGTNVLSTVRVYYPDREETGDPAWEDKPDLPAPREGLQATALVETVYISGGYDAKGQSQTGILRFNESANTWEQVDQSPQPISPDAALIGFDTNLHLFGGVEDGVFSTAHRSYQAIYMVQLPAVSN